MRQAAEQGSCAQCHGAGWVIREQDGIERAVRCPSCTTDNRRRVLLENAGIPSRYQSKGFADYTIHHPLQDKARAAARGFVNQFPLVERGLLLVGPCGVGKTHLSVAILQQLIRDKLISGRFVDEAELLRRLQYSYGPDSPETQREVMVPLMEVDLLVWDDLGTGRPTEWVAETIRTILNHRYTHNNPTVLTSNWLLERKAPRSGGSRSLVDRDLEEKTLQERIGKRLYSRILEMCRVVRLDGPDYRAGVRSGKEPAKQPLKPTGAAKKTQVKALSLLQCPKCGSKLLEELGRAEKGPGVIDLQCRCQDCGTQFGANYTHRTAQIKYFE